MSEINPWVRSNQERFCPETLELIPATEQERYERVMLELQQAGAALIDATVRFQAAQDNRTQFFKEQGAYD